MTMYRYTATRIGGKAVRGQIDVPTPEDAVRVLRERGLMDIDVQLVQSDSREEAPSREEDPSRPLPPQDAEVVLGHVSHLSTAGLPLAPGLRAAARESDDTQIAAALRRLADQLDQGQSLEEAISSGRSPLPPYLRHLVAAAVRTGQLGVALDEIVEHQRNKRRLRRSILTGFSYPVVVTCLSLVLLLFIIVFIGGIHLQMFEDFQLSLPKITLLLVWYRDYGLLAFGGTLLATAGLGFLLWLLLPRPRWLGLLASFPMFGPLWCWAGFADWCSLLGLLVRYRIPLAEALRMASEGTENRYVAHLSKRLADGVSQGQSLSRVLGQVPQFPASVMPLLRWGETSDSLVGALEAGRDLFNQRVKARVVMLQSVLPPMMFIAIASGVLFVVGALFTPLISMIQGLS
jgi:general secretion pathway protein F